MTASSPHRPPFPSIAAKSSSTAQSSQLNAVADSKLSGARSASRVPPATRQRQEWPRSTDATSERETLALIRRVLVAGGSHGADSRASPAPIEGVLPPLTSSNEVDVQLYAIVAVIVRDFVNSWYSKITPDHTFVEEVIQIIAHCSRAIEQRIRDIDVPELILNDVQALVEEHIAAYRTATTAQAALQYAESPLRIYHALNPHPALDPTLSAEERRNAETAYRQLLIQGALAVLLPTEDLANTCLRTLLTDVIADLILGRAVAEQVCEPWFLHSAVSKIVHVVTSRSKPSPKLGEKPAGHTPRSRLEKFGLLNAKTPDKSNNSSTTHQSALSAYIWRLLQFAFVAYQFTRFLLIGLVHARGLPRRTLRCDISTLPPTPVSKTGRLSVADGRSPRAVLNFRIFSCVSTILDLSVRMPWLSSSLEFWQHILTTGPGRYGGSNSTLDKFIYHNVSTRVFSPALLPHLLVNVRTVIFPNNSMGPPAPPPPSQEEALKIRRKAAEDILSLIPSFASRRLFAVRPDGTDEGEQQAEEEMLVEIEESILGWTDNKDMNKHLAYGILELCVLKICPEMIGKTPSELLAERGVGFQEDVAANEADEQNST